MFGETQLMIAYILFLITTAASPILLIMSKKTILSVAQFGLVATLFYFFVTDIASMGYYANNFNLFNGLVIVNTGVTLYAVNVYLKQVKSIVQNEEEIGHEEINNEFLQEEKNQLRFTKPFSNMKEQLLANGNTVFLPEEKIKRKEHFLQTIKERNGIEL